VLSSAVSARQVNDLGPALAAYQQGDYQQAYQLFEPLAIRGDHGAEFYLALMCHNGQGVERDVDETLKWLRRSASGGEPAALTLLGRFYAAGGHGVEQSFSSARRYWGKAAKRGDVEAQVLLAQLYSSGEAGRPQLTKAVQWWKKAARQGHADSQYRLGMMYEMGGGGLKKSARQAKGWWQKAAAQGHVEAQIALARAAQTDTRPEKRQKQ